MRRPTVLRAIAAALAAALWADVAITWLRSDRVLVEDVGYAAFAGVLASGGLLAQLRKPDRAIAGMQQLGICVVVLLLAGAVDATFLVAGALGALALVALLIVHPSGGTFFAVPDEVSPLLVGLALLVAAPSGVYAAASASDERAGLTAFGVAVPLVALLAAIRTVGWRVPAWSAAGAAAIWGLTCVLFPTRTASEGRVWGALAIMWAVLFALAARREAHAAAPTD